MLPKPTESLIYQALLHSQLYNFLLSISSFSPNLNKKLLATILVIQRMRYKNITAVTETTDKGFF